MKENAKVVMKKLVELKPNPNNARNGEKDYAKDDISMQELMRDISIRGIVTPLKVLNDGTILFGNRRFHAATYLGLKELPCIVDDDQVDSVEQLMQQVSENMIRKYPASLERGRAFYELIKSGKETEASLTARTGASDVGPCIREYRHFLAARETIGAARVDSVMAEVAKRNDATTIARAVFKRCAIPDEAKVAVLELACEKRANTSAVENVIQRINQISESEKTVSKEAISAMMDKAMETDSHQVIMFEKDWEWANNDYQEMQKHKIEGTPPTIRHYFIDIIKLGCQELKKNGGYYKAVIMAKRGE